MKIHLLTDIKDCVDGYVPILLSGNEIKLEYPENSITSILFIDGIEQIPYQNIDNFLINLRRLLRIDGKIVIGGVDAGCLCRDLINGNTDLSTFNSIIFSKKSIHDSRELSERFKRLGLKIDKIAIKGAVYELHASRSS
jgi:hypothetical protein